MIKNQLMVFLLVQSLKNVFFFLIFYVYRNTNLSVYHKCVWCPWRPEECMSDSQELDTACCELLCGHWEVDPGQLEKRSLFLTVEVSLQPLQFLSKKEWQHICLPMSRDVEKKEKAV